MNPTPGPWEIRDGGEEVYGTAIYEVGAHDLDPLAAVQNEADARLIAAAPDLFAALEELQAWVDKASDLGAPLHSESPVCVDARAAIAKAKGLEP